MAGTVPDLSALTNLRSLSLGSNQLSGTVPDLSALTNLQSLSLSANQLSGTVPDLGALANLQSLSLHSNRLSGTIPGLSALTNLQYLYLGGNRLSGPIPDLSALTNLRELSLHRNRLSGPIPDLSALTNLKELYLHRNRLSGTIPDLGALTNLKVLSLYFNQLSGTIPDLGALTNLRVLDLAGNRLCLPESSASSGSNDVVAAHLNSLNLPSCASQTLTATPTPTPTATPTPTPQLQGQLPAATPTYTPTATAQTTAPDDRAVLVALYKATGGDNWKRNDNWLTGKPLSTWDGVTTDADGRVTGLLLGANRLNGSLPDLSALTSLRELWLDHNQLTGPIPDLSALANLRALVLVRSQLTGPIPDLSALTNLVTLWLQSNRLTGPIPDLSALTNLSTLYLQSNRLTGSIPDLGALTNLRALDLNGNRLTGPIPDLGALTNLRALDLNGNRLTGPVPDLSALTELRWLVLNGNQLTGSIPDLSALTELEGMKLSANQLDGSIPGLDALTNLRELHIGDNRLTGPVPDLYALTNLRELDLSGNRLTGPVPDLYALTSLRELRLSDNRLTGPVPDLDALTNLVTLYIEGNRLCLPEGSSLAGLDSAVAAHLKSLSLPACAETPPGRPQDLTASAGDKQIALTWGKVASAASYQLRTWDGVNRRWGRIGGALTDTSYTHAGVAAGRRHYYQVRAVDANGLTGAWSQRTYASLASQPLLPLPPPSLGLHLFYQKYVDAGGVAVVAPSEVTDQKLFQASQIITSTLSHRSDLLSTMAANRFRYVVYDGARGNTSQLPDWPFSKGRVGTAIRMRNPDGWMAVGPADHPDYCYVVIHEFAHLLDYAIRLQPGGQDFRPRLETAYRAALQAGLWTGKYASWNVQEYWAETVTFWFSPRRFALEIPEKVGATGWKLADYDPAAARLIEDVFGDAALPSFCAP